MALSCSIKRNRDGSIKSVNTISGAKSTLFDKIASIPVIKNSEEALGFFKKIYSSKFMSSYGDWTKASPVNPVAYAKIKRGINAVPEEHREGVLKKAASMYNPILVGGISVEKSKDGYSFHSVSTDNGVFLVDAISTETIDLSNTLPGERTEETEDNVLMYAFSPVTYYKDMDGNDYVLVRDGYKAYSSNELSSLNSEADFSFETYESGEPKLFFVTSDGKATESYKDALDSNDRAFNAGFVKKVPKKARRDKNVVELPDGSHAEFFPIMEIPGSTDINTIGGVVNRLIKTGWVSPEKVYNPETGGYSITGAGFLDGVRLMNAARAFRFLSNLFGVRNVSMDDYGRIDVKEVDTKNVTVYENGEPSTISKEDIKKQILRGNYKSMQERYAFFDSLVVSLLYENNDLYRDNIRGIIADSSAEDLKRRRALLDILSTLGIKMMSISEYVEKYELKNGVEPSAKAIADLANKVIAVGENATLEDVAEEVAHFLVEAYRDQSAISDMLESVDNTEQWDNYASSYYDIYGKTMEGDALEEAVRREILGKVIAANFSRNASPQSLSRVESKSPGFIQKLADFARGIIDQIKSHLTDQKSRVKNISDLIDMAEFSKNRDMFDADLLNDNTFTMYSLDESENRSRKEFINDRITDMRKILRSLRVISSDRAALSGMTLDELRSLEEKINRTEKEIEDSELVASINAIISTAKAQVKYLSRVADGSITTGEKGIDPTDRQNLDILRNQVQPMLREILGFVKNNKSIDSADSVYMIKDIRDVMSGINDVISDMDATLKSDTETFVENFLEKIGYPDSKTKETIISLIKEVQSGVSAIGRWFGILEHSPIVTNMLGALISRNNYNARQFTIQSVDPFLAMAENGGWNISRYKTLIKRHPNGKYSSYLIDVIDHAKFDRDYKEAQLRIVADIIGDTLTDEQVEKILERGKYDIERDMVVDGKDAHIKKTLVLSQDSINFEIFTIQEEQEYRRRMRNWEEANTEQPTNASYRGEIDAIYESINSEADATGGRRINPKTIEFLSDIARRKYALRQPFYKDGKFDEEAFIASGRDYDLAAIDRERREKKTKYMYSPANPYGVSKTGDDLEIAEDLERIDKKLNEYYESKRRSSAATSEFVSTVGRIARDSGAMEAYKFMAAAGSLSFSDSFWDTFDSAPAGDKMSHELLADAIANVTTGDTADRVLQLAADITANKNIIKEIVRKARDFRNPGETNYELLTSGEIETIRILTNEIEQFNNELRVEAKTHGIDSSSYIGDASEWETSSNRAFNDAWRSSGMKEWEFALKHMTKAKANLVESFRRKILLYGYGKTSLSPMEIDFLCDMYGIDKSLLNPSDKKGNVSYVFSDITRKEGITSSSVSPAAMERIADKIAASYSKRFLYAYFKRTAPKGYSEFMKKLERNEVDMEQFVQDVERGISSHDYGFDLKYLSYNANRRWSEETAEEAAAKNPNYRQNHGYGRFIPKISKYKDNSFIENFGIRTDSEGNPIFDEDGNMTATRNLDDFNMLNTLKGIARTSYENYNERRNVCKLPQVSRQGLEKGYDILGSRKVLRSMIGDFVSDRIDESIYGTTDQNEMDIIDRPRAIPKYYMNDLENDDDVAHDLTFSYSKMLSSSFLYREKKNTISDVMGLQQILLDQKFKNGKRPETTQTYAMFKDHMEAHWYGVSSTTRKFTKNIMGHEVDLSKFMMNLERFMSVMNLALSPFVAVTGMVTGQMNFIIESVAGQYIDPYSIRKSYTEVAKLTGDYASEIGKLDRKSELYVLGNHMGIYGYEDRLYGASFNRAARALTRDIMFKPMEILSGPLNPQIMFSVLYGTRFYDGKFYTFKEFKDMKRAMGEEVNAEKEWRGIEEMNLRDMLKVEDGKLVIRPAFGATEEQINNQLGVSRNRIRSLAQICNGSLNEENRTAAHRNWIFRLATSHRGWVTLTGQRLWSDKTFNLQTMQLEEGLMITPLRLLDRVAKSLSEKGLNNIMDTIKSELENMNDYEKQNIFRLVVYTATFMMSLIAMMAIYNIDGDDDEDDDWVSQFVTYIGFRTVNEILSQMPIWFELNIVDILSDPFVMMRKMKDLTDIRNWDPFTTVKSGTYKGESYAFRLLAKQSFIKQWYSIRTAQDVKRSKDWWKQNNRRSLMIFDAMFGRKEENEEVVK